MLDFEHDRPTRLEERVVNVYRKHRPYSPQDIDLDLFIYDAGIWVHYLPEPSTNYQFRDEMYSIIVDNRLPRRQQGIELTHELGHILLHVGHQTFMPDDEGDRQKWQADRFATYALAPTFMIADCIKPTNSRQRAERRVSSVRYRVRR
ncbi:hypothetical protein GCM10025857_03310 [Alicyclobacillus contaminans]|uniref:ImmA/IrrE family metallo-endopeptidase n=1 Tax=Alicyclobacillus contaminans TaxID=392016 RepID=UPI00146FC2FB|nr:ImmA/IrrE family metallo-endopeptidase [Alicyclobacillus contaminans]GMA48974.1 hypothetical protein GCM10025857_03310 [Alicyclobacillus contaminans]